MRRFVLNDLPREPWRNGGGTMQTVASGDTRASEADWRISCADIVKDGAYSIYPGIDRQQMLIEGRLLSLHGFDTPLRLERIGDSVSFPGEAPLHATLGAGPVRAWNVLMRRDLATCTLRMSRDEIVHMAPRALGLARVLLVLEGSYRLRRAGADPIELRAGEGLCEEGAFGRVALQPLAPHSTLLSTEVVARP